MIAMDTFILPGYYVRQIHEQIRALGLDTERWLQSYQLRPEQLSEPFLELSLLSFKDMVRSIVQLTGEPGVGLLVGSTLLAHTHGILGYAALNSSTLRQVVDLFERFMVLRTTLVHMEHEEDEVSYRIVFRENVALEDVRGPIMDAVVLAIRNVLSFITMDQCPVEQVAFSSPTGNHKLALSLFGCTVSYASDWDGFCIARQWLDRPLTMSDPRTFAEAEVLCSRELQLMEGRVSLAGRVRQLLIAQQSQFPKLDIVAHHMLMTSRTLHRRLTEEGTSFHQLLDEVRHKLAVEHLRRANLSIKEIAFTLGYGDPANFRRAFKRWEGLSPQDFQQRSDEASRLGH